MIKIFSSYFGLANKLTSISFFKSTLFKITLLVVIYLASRLLTLLYFPLFLDEGIYINWSKFILEDSGYGYISMQDGKTPLFYWLTAFFHSLLSSPLLITARTISVLAGAVSLLAWMQIIRLELNSKAAWIFGCLFLISPIGFFIERLAFADSLLTAFSSLSLMMLVTIRHTSNNKKIFLMLSAILGGVFLGLAFYTKSTARLILISELIIIALWSYQSFRQKKLAKVIVLLASSAIIYLIYHELLSYLRVGSYRFWDMIGNKERELTFSISEVLQRLTTPYVYLPFFSLSIQYLLFYLGGIFILSLFGWFVILRRNHNQLWILFYSMFIYLGILLSGKVMASRYFYLLSPAVIALATIGIQQLLNTKRFRPFIFLLLSITVVQAILIALYSPYAVFSRDDNNYFRKGVLTAYGLTSLDSEIKKPHSSSAVGVVGIWGVNEGSQIYLEDKGIATVSLKLLSASGLNKLKLCPSDQKKINQQCWSSDINKLLSQPQPNKYLYITDDTIDPQILLEFNKFRLIKEFQRPGSGSKTYLLELI